MLEGCPIGERLRVEGPGRLVKELADETALLGYSPKFVDRLLAETKR